MPRFFRTGTTTAPPPLPPSSLQVPRTVALYLAAFLVTSGVFTSFAESYRALYWWAQGHAVHGIWAVVWPIQIDAFMAVGELALFVALVDGWKPKHRSLPWLLIAAGLAVSVSGNVGHVVSANVLTHVTAAVPALTAYAMLATGLGLLKRVVAYQKPEAAARKRPGPKPGSTRKPRAVQSPAQLELALDPEDAVKAQAFASLPAPEAEDHLFRPFDPDESLTFPRLGADGHPVRKAA